VKAGILVLAAVGALACAPSALADACGVPDSGPLWIDFAGHDAPVPARPGLVLAVASGTDTPKRMRDAGAGTVFYDLNFNRRVGTTTSPADPSLLEQRAKTFFDYVVTATGCQTPIVGLNELFGAQTPTPWSETNAQYRANVLAFAKALADLGARPLLSIPNPPFTSSPEAAEWWRQVSRVAILQRQVYFTSPNSAGISRLGPVAGSRVLRQGMRNVVNKLTQIGIPSGRISLSIQFHSSPGLGARAGLQPTSAWLELVKLKALAAKHVLREYKLHSVWSWGWATYNPNAVDPDKPAAACVWLWARDQSLCDGPAMAGPDFNASLTDGQLLVPPDARCVFPDGRRIERNAVNRFARLTGDIGYATSVLFEHAVLEAVEPVDPKEIASAERAVVRASFGGNRARYRAALAGAQLTLADARSVVAARLRRDVVQSRLRPPPPTRAQIADFLATYASAPVRLVDTTRGAPWLGGARRGWAVSTLAPQDLFSLAGPGEIDTPDGAFSVTRLGPSLPLGLLPRSQAEAVARSALAQFAREQVYRRWLLAEQQRRLATAVCLNDLLPTPSATDLSPFAPFLLPS
jgi:hypothetical protein